MQFVARHDRKVAFLRPRALLQLCAVDAERRRSIGGVRVVDERRQRAASASGVEAR